MANPFLMGDDDVADMGAATNEIVFNPFLVQAGEPETDFMDNPFTTQATNPFADFGGGDDTAVTAAAPTAAPISDTSAPPHTPDAAMSFFGTTIQEIEDDLSSAEPKLANPLANFDDGVSAYSSEDELSRKKVPPRPLPPSQTTQDLICAVAGHLEEASSEMLGRLPKTRSPSPVSMRDLHSPSPTPELDATVDNLLDYSEPLQHQQQRDLFGQEDLLGGSDDNPFGAPIPAADVSMTQPPTKSHPNRPPPPRPTPPRPAPPPAPAAQPVQQAAPPQQQELDLFDMFGTSAPPQPSRPPAPKTKEDILSLFSTPKPAQHQQAQPAQQDLLSGDILESIPANGFALPPPLTEGVSQPIAPPPLAAPVATVETTILPVEPQPTITEPMDETAASEPQPTAEHVEDSQKPAMDSIAPDAGCKRAPTPDIEITTVESLPRSDDEEEPPADLEKDTEPSVELDKADSGIIEESDQSPTSESNFTTQAVHGSPVESFIAEPIAEPEQMDTGLDFAPSIPSGSASANPFASPETEDVYPTIPQQTNIFAAEEPIIQPMSYVDAYAAPPPVPPHPIAPMPNVFAMDEGLSSDNFDAFAAKFDSVKKEPSLLDGFGGISPATSTGDAWGAESLVSMGGGFGVGGGGGDDGFGGDDESDAFLAMKAPEPAISRKDSIDSIDNEKEFNVVIRPKCAISSEPGQILAPPPPPRSSQNNSMYSGDSSPRFNPFDKGDEVASADGIPSIPEPAAMTRTDSQETPGTPGTPLFDDDVSQPLEDFPRITYTGSGWEMQLRQPNKKKITGQRFWKKVFVRLVYQGDNPVVQLLNQATDKEPFQELPLQPCYSVSEIGAQQYDQFGKIFTMKLQYIFYKERPGVRPGQVTKAERLTNKLSQFAAYAIQGDYQGVKEFGSDLKKLGLPVEHAPQVSQLFKIGSMAYEDLKQFSVTIEEALFKLASHRDRALNYKSEEVQVTAVDELYVEQDFEGHVHKQIARVRLFFLGFLSGMPWIELGVNDMWRQGKEVVGRHDIIPVVTEEWIRLEGVEFHNTVQLDEYERSRIIKFQPPDACYIELMRFRVRPPKNRELPLQIKASWCVNGNRVELRADVLVPGFASRKLGQIPCEDVSIRFPIPECWIYLFRVEKHFRYGSVKSAHRRTGKIKGIERILGTVDALQESLIEVTSGQAKYEHHHRAIVWRCPRLPKEGQGAYTTHQMVCRMALTSYDQVPEKLAEYCYVEFTMPATQVSHTTVRSVSVQDSDSDEPPEKYVRYLARHEYRVGIEYTTAEVQNAYLTATRVIKEEPAQQQPAPAASPMAPSDSDSDSN